MRIATRAPHKPASLGTPICARPGCQNFAAPGQRFCCRDHSPLGNFDAPKHSPNGGPIKPPGGKP